MTATQSLASVGVLLLAATLTAADPTKVRIVQTNAPGDNIHLIDPATNRIVGEIKDIEVNHGASAAPDGSRLYFTNEAEHTVDFVAAYSMPDLKPLGIVHTGHHPDGLTFSPDSKSVYVANAGSNSVSVVDVKSMKEVSTIKVGQVPKRNITAKLQ